jgi:outer membrane biosynthesis protein TonB
MMFGNFSQQMKNSTKPVSTLLEMNAKTLEMMSQQNTVFFSGVMSDSVKLVESLASQTELKGVMAAQSVYAESVRERLTSTSKTTFGNLSAIGNEVAGMMKGSLETATAEAKQAFTQTAPVVQQSPSVKKASAKKAPSKQKKAEAAPKVVAKTIQKPAEKPAPTIKPQATPAVAEKPKVVKAAVNKEAPVKPATKKVATKKTTAKKVVAKQNVSKTAPTKAPSKKAVAELSPADVKASPSKSA